MKVLVVYAHPNPLSFNHAILESVAAALGEAGHEVRVKDLYAEKPKVTLDGEDFQGILSGKVPEDILREQAEVLWAEGLVFVYPIWWFSMPAILKGWIDRVFLNGFAFEIGPQGARGLLRHRKAMVFTTTGGLEEAYAQGNGREVLLRPMTDGTLRFCGIGEVSAKVFYGVPSATENQRKAMLAEAARLARAF
ncbi:MAG: NAD(P)H-dependent oxidoreductase [Acidobacteriota bacterium]